jgi:hypothetical protein
MYTQHIQVLTHIKLVITYQQTMMQEANSRRKRAQEKMRNKRGKEAKGAKRKMSEKYTARALPTKKLLQGRSSRGVGWGMDSKSKKLFHVYGIKKKNLSRSIPGFDSP